MSTGDRETDDVGTWVQMEDMDVTLTGIEIGFWDLVGFLFMAIWAFIVAALLVGVILALPTMFILIMTGGVG